MNKAFVVEFDYFRNRKEVFESLREISKRHDNNVLHSFQIFINNIPTSLEFYVYLSYASTATQEVEDMKRLLLCNGIYRPDISLKTLIERIGVRGFNSFPVLNELPTPDHLFFYHSKEVVSHASLSRKHIQRLKREGYDAFEKLTGGTTLFISHPSKEKQNMEQIMPYLTWANELVWLDKYRITNADDSSVRKEIAEGLNNASKVLFYVTNDFLESFWCNFELEFSLKLYQEKEGYSIFLVIEESVKDQFFSRYPIESIVGAENILIVSSILDLEGKIEGLVSKPSITQ